MKAEIRRAVALIAANLFAERKLMRVYDYATGQQFVFSGDVSDDRVALYDYAAAAHITGNKNNIFHYGTSSHVSLGINARTISGYDYTDGSHFTGNIDGKNVRIYDYKTGATYQYQCA